MHLDALREKVEKLKGLLDYPQPELHTWERAVDLAVIAITVEHQIAHLPTRE